jgi:asparagine synthetase A
MAIMNIDDEIRRFRIKYPEYDDWFMDSPNNIRGVSSDLLDAGHNYDSDLLDTLAELMSEDMDKRGIPQGN